MIRIVRLTTLVAALLAATAMLAGCGSDADRPQAGQSNTLWPQAQEIQPDAPWVVGLGDSYISGEGGGWASNGTTNSVAPFYGGWSLGTIDEVYGDSPDRTEEIEACHRTASAPMFLGPGFNVKNLACSGATTETYLYAFDKPVQKPGIDWANADTSLGHVDGQVTMLEQFAKGKDIDAVVLSIGGNDLGFVDILSACVTAFLVPNGTPCLGSPKVAKLVNPVTQQQLSEVVERAIVRINEAMSKAGHDPRDWRLIYNMYPSPIPPSSQITYDQGYEREYRGGCGVLDVDADWVNEYLMGWINQGQVNGARMATNSADIAPVTMIDNTRTLEGHRLCEVGTERPDGGVGVPPPELGASVEWIRNLSIYNQELQSGSPSQQEAFHPNYFGQRALATCVRETVELSSDPAVVKCIPDGPTQFSDTVPPLLTNLKIQVVDQKF